MDHTMAGIEDIVGQHGNYHVRDRYVKNYLIVIIQAISTKMSLKMGICYYYI